MVHSRMRKFFSDGFFTMSYFLSLLYSLSYVEPLVSRGGHVVSDKTGNKTTKK